MATGCRDVSLCACTAAWGVYVRVTSTGPAHPVTANANNSADREEWCMNVSPIHKNGRSCVCLILSSVDFGHRHRNRSDRFGEDYLVCCVARCGCSTHSA